MEVVVNGYSMNLSLFISRYLIKRYYSSSTLTIPYPIDFNEILKNLETGITDYLMNEYREGISNTNVMRIASLINSNSMKQLSYK